MVTPDTNMGQCSKCNITMRADRCPQGDVSKIGGGKWEAKIICKIPSVFSPSCKEYAKVQK